MYISVEYSLSLFFFFSSRRRHTRFDCDWSSDVCSSDLKELRDGTLTRGYPARTHPNRGYGHREPGSRGLGHDWFDHRQGAVCSLDQDLDLSGVLVQVDHERLAVGLQLRNGLLFGHRPKLPPQPLGRRGARWTASFLGRDPHWRDGLLAMRDLLLEGDDLAVDLIQSQIERRLRIGPALACVEHRRAAAVEVQVDPADRGGKSAPLALFGKLHLGVDHLDEVAFEAGWAVLARHADPLPPPLRTVR